MSFAEFGDGVSLIGRIHPQNGSMQEFRLLTENTDAVGTIAGADGSLWFTQTHVKIGRISTADRPHKRPIGDDLITPSIGRTAYYGVDKGPVKRRRALASALS